VIKPQRFTVSRLGREPNRRIWVYFDTRLLVELEILTARDLVYALADETGLAVYPAKPRRTRVLRRARALVRRVPLRISWGASHAHR
jgi:hypothetical protein